MTTTTDAPLEADAPTTDRRKIVALGALGALALAGGAWFFLHGGSSEDSSLAPPVRAIRKPVVTGAAVRPAVPAATKPVKSAAILPAATNLKLGRDPFKALYIVPAVTAPTTTTTAPKSSGAETTAPTTTTTTTSGGTTKPTTGTTTTAPTTYALKMVSVSGSGKTLTAQFDVAGKLQYARAGSVFGRTSELKLLSLQQTPKGVWTASIQVGDSQPFELDLGKIAYVM